MFGYIVFWSVPIITLASYCLLLLMFAASYKDKVIKAFFPLLISLILWSMSSLFMKMQLYPSALFWNHVMVSAMAASPLALYWFMSVYTNNVNKRLSIFWGVITLAIIAMSMLGLITTDAQVHTNMISSGVNSYKSIEFTYTLGAMAIPSEAMVALFLAFIIDKTRRAMRKESVKYYTIKPILAGSVILFLGVVCNLIPTIGKYPIDIFAAFIMAVLILVSIFKRRMFELKFFVTRGVVYAVFVIILTGAYVYIAMLTQQIVSQNFSGAVPYASIIIALLFAVVFRPLYSVANTLADKLVYKAEYPRRQALKHFSENIANNIDLEQISLELLEAAQMAIRAKNVYLFLRDESTQNYSAFKSSVKLNDFDMLFTNSNPIVRFLLSHNECITRSDLRTNPFFKSMWDEEYTAISQIDAQVIVPVKCRNELIGMIILTKKENNASYTINDYELLTTLGSSTAMAIDNAYLFAKTQKEAQIDSQTRLYNHRYFCNQLEQFAAKGNSMPLSLMIIDLDMFKLYNDLFGHIEGDNALKTIATFIKDIVRNKGTACRYGGGEFAVLLPYLDSEKAFALGEQIRLAVQNEFLKAKDTTQRFLTVSIGICTYPVHAPTSEELLIRADVALYKAKNSGKNKTIVYGPSTNEKTKRLNHASQTDPSYTAVEESPNYTATIYALTAAIDIKDHFTFGHSQKVAEYTQILAKEIGMDQAHIEILKEAALLHDVGKIGIPESILIKPGKLTDEECVIMKKHVEMSITMIKHLPSFNHAIPAILEHHERWDGMGYPRGISGESISLAARCLSIADAFDAIISHRPYKQSRTVEYALDEIQRNSGTQFDPQLATLFISLVKNGKIKAEQAT